MSELQYGRIPQLEAQLKQADKAPSKGSKPKLLRTQVGAEEIAEVVTAWTGIPAGRMLEGETAKLLRMEEVIGERLIGQKSAVAAVSDAVRRSRAGISDPNRPTGSFLFLGPTGVGKTELARTLADFLFDDERAMVRIDMSEYQEKHNVSRLVGAPPGYVGYEEGGQLTEAVRRRPYAVVLLDEIEKAHPDVFNVLLQLLDDGRLTDGQGRTVDFTNTVLIMTSNLGGGADERTVMNIVRSHFKPEFLNRIDSTVVFHSLTREQIRQIVDLQLASVFKQLKEKNIAIEVTEAAKDVLGRKGYDEVYGARPLRRVIQNLVEDHLSEDLLRGQFGSGDTVTIDAAGEGEGEELVFNVRHPELPAVLDDAEKPALVGGEGS